MLSTNILLSDKYDKEYLKAIEYSNNNEYHNADKIFKKLIQKSIKNKDYYKTLDFYTAEGYNFEQKGEFLKSLDSYSKAILHLNKYSLNDYKNKLYLYNNYGNLNCKLEDYNTALRYYKYALKSIDKDNDLNTYIASKINIACTHLDMGNLTKAKSDLENLYLLVINENHLTNKLAVILNLLELNLQINNITEVNKINTTLIKENKSNILKEYLIEYKLLEFKTSIMNNQNNVDSLYTNIINQDLNEFQINSFNKEYGIYLLNKKKSISKGIQLLESTIKYYERIKNYEEVLMISNTLLNNVENISLNRYKNILELQDKIIFKQKKDLFKTIEINELLTSDLEIIKQELIEAKFMNYMLYTILFSIIIISFLTFLYLNLKKNFNLNYFKKQDLELKLNEVEFKLSNNIREIQELIYTKDEIDIKDLKIQNNNLINLIKNLRK